MRPDDQTVVPKSEPPPVILQQMRGGRGAYSDWPDSDTVFRDTLSNTAQEQNRVYWMIPISPTMTIPLRHDEHGAIRIGKTRVLLELVIHAYYTGETPEGIVESYPSLTTSEVYAVIGYYLANREAIDEYVRRRDEQAERIVSEMESKLTPEARDLRTRLRAYREQHKIQR